jgi:hypothetical protein
MVVGGGGGAETIPTKGIRARGYLIRFFNVYKEQLIISLFEAGECAEAETPLLQSFELYCKGREKIKILKNPE